MHERSYITEKELHGEPNRVLAKLERRGEWTGTSDIYNTGYCAAKGYFVTFRGNDGVMAMPIKDLRRYIKELTEYADILEYRQSAGIKGA